MERAQVIALALIVAALVLFGVGYVVDDGTTPFGDRVVPGAFADQRRGIGLSNHETETRRGAQRSAPGKSSKPQRGQSGADEDDSDGDDGSAEMIAGARRGGSVLGSSGSWRDEAAGVNGVSEEMIEARTGTLPRAGGGISEPPPHHPNEPAAEEPPPEQQPHDPTGVLLSIPLKGSVDPEQGGGPTQADGVVVDGNAVDFTNEAQYTLPAEGHVDGAMGTIAFDIEPHWAGSDETNNSLLQIRDEHQWENNLQIVKNYNSLRFIIIDSTGVETNVNVYIDSWQPGDGHRVTATWGEALMALYVDGQQVGQATVPNDLAFKDSTPIHVGSDFPGTVYSGANGRISNLTIYGRTLSAGEVN